MKVGSKVQWESQSQGIRSQKQGKIVAILLAGRDPCKLAKEQFPGHMRLFECGARQTTRYMVEVDRGPTKKMGLYIPYPGHLERW